MLSNMKSLCWVSVQKFLLLSFVASCAHVPSSPDVGGEKLSKVGDKPAVLILYLSDLHSQLRADERGRGGYAQLKKWIDSERAKAGTATDVVVIGGGDLLGKGSIPCQETKDRDCAPLLKELGFNYSALGNYELYNTPTELAALVRAAGGSFLGMNVAPKTGAVSWVQAPLKFKGARSGLEFWLASWTSAVDVKNYTVRSAPSPSEWMAWTRQWSAPVLFVTHQELEKDAALLKQACQSLSPQVQVLALLKSNDHRVMQQNTSLCAPLLEPGAFGRHALKLLLTRDEGNPLRLKVESEFVEISGIGEDTEMKKRIDALYARHAPNADEVIFTAEKEISREAMAAWVAEAYHKRMKADAAIANIGYVKHALPSGPVTREQFMLALPYKNDLMGLDWPVKDLEAALCASSKRTRDDDLDWGSELAFSGFALEGAGTPGCRVLSNKKSLKIVVDEYLVSRSARWLGRDLAPRVFRFGVDSRRVGTMQLQIQKPGGAR